MRASHSLVTPTGLCLNRRGEADGDQAHYFGDRTGHGCAETHFLRGPPNGCTLPELEVTSEELGHRVSLATRSRWARELEWDQVPFVVVFEPADRAHAGPRRRL